jgi:hypothetical protein
LKNVSAKTSAGWLNGVTEKPWILWILSVILVTVVITSVFIHAIHHDVGWFIYESGRLLDGARIYKDTVHFNPPLISFWAVPPVWLARLVGGSEITFFKIYQAAVVVFSLLLCRSIVKQSLEPTAIGIGKCLVVVLFFLELRPYFFGQREQIMLVLVMPYLLAAVGYAMGRPTNPKMSVCVGILAGIGLALKPHFLLLWVMVEGYLFLFRKKRSSWRRIENLGIVGFLGGYGALVLLWMPEYSQKILPMAMQTYGAFNCSTSYLLRHPYVKLWGVATVALWLVRPTVESRELRRVMFVASGSFLVMAFAQRKGFYYHFFPVGAAAVVLLTVCFWDYIENRRSKQGKVRAGTMATAVAVTSVLLVVSGVKLTQYARSEDTALLSPLIRIVEEHAKSKHILLLSTSLYPGFPLVNYSGAGWSSRFGHLWLLPSFYADSILAGKEVRYHGEEEMGSLEKWFVDAVVSDIREHPPSLMIVDCSRNKQGFGTASFDYVAYFLRDARFAALWAEYKSIDSVGSYKVYERDKC